MAQAIPLSRFPLVASRNVDEVISALNERVGGERTCISSPSTKHVSTFNFLKLGTTGVISHDMSAMKVNCAADLPGSFYLCRKGRLTMSICGQTHDIRPGQLLCVLPGSDRTASFDEGFSSLSVRVQEADLKEAFNLLGYEGAVGWSTVTTVIDEGATAARKFSRLLRDTVRLYDTDENFPDRRIDEIMGRSLTFAAAEMLGSMLTAEPRIDGPSFEVAEAAERVITERYFSPLTAAEIAEAVGQTLPCVKASLLLYTGLLPTELLTLVRLIAADEYLRRSYKDPSLVAEACGFVTASRYQSALAQRERLMGLLKRRTFGRGYSA